MHNRSFMTRQGNRIDDTVLFKLADFFKVFGDSTRVRILHALMQKERSVNELTSVLSMTQPAVSQQLRILKSNHLVKSRKEGQSSIYSPDDSHVETILKIGLEHIFEKGGR